MVNFVARGFDEKMIDSGLVGSTGRVPREQKLLKGHLPRVIYQQVYEHTKKNVPGSVRPLLFLHAPTIFFLHAPKMCTCIHLEGLGCRTRRLSLFLPRSLSPSLPPPPLSLSLSLASSGQSRAMDQTGYGSERPHPDEPFPGIRFHIGNWSLPSRNWGHGSNALGSKRIPLFLRSTEVPLLP